jgi:hypothetical protein
MTADYWTQPTAVLMTMRDGTQTEQVFATRLQAEIWLALLPALMSIYEHDEGVAWAMLSPLAEVEGRRVLG